MTRTRARKAADLLISGTNHKALNFAPRRVRNRKNGIKIADLSAFLQAQTVAVRLTCCKYSIYT
jgi:hypothetical protein